MHSPGYLVRLGFNVHEFLDDFVPFCLRSVRHDVAEIRYAVKWSTPPVVTGTSFSGFSPWRARTARVRAGSAGAGPRATHFSLICFCLFHATEKVTRFEWHF